jgi:hypothetical protein
MALLCQCSHPQKAHTLYGYACSMDNGKDDGRQCKCKGYKPSPIMGEEEIIDESPSPY